MEDAKSEDPKAKSKSVSLLPDLWVKVEERAAEKYSGNRSNYIRDLVKADLAGKSGDVLSPTVLVDLTRRLLGELDAEQMAQAMEGKDQREKLRRVLERILAEEFDLELYSEGYVDEQGATHREKRIEDVVTMAGENFRNYLQRRHKKHSFAPVPQDPAIAAGKDRPEKPRRQQGEKRKHA